MKKKPSRSRARVAENARSSRLSLREALRVVEERLGKEHRLADRLLHQQAAAIKASIDGMALLNEKGEYIYLNAAYARIYGFESPRDLSGRSWLAHYEPAELKRFGEEIMPAFWRAGRWRGEARGLGKDGRSFPQELSLIGIEEGGMVCVVRDITEQKKAEAEHRRLLELEKTARAEAEAASRAKDEFLAVVSHELRTPMTAILGWMWLLKSGDVPAVEQARAMEVIDRNMKLQAQIIEDLLDVSRIVTGKLHLDVRDVDLLAVLRSALDTVRAMAESKSVSLAAPLEAAPVMVRGDSYRLQQVFWNLLSNAIKFNREGGWARVRVSQDDEEVSVSVEDDGQGIEPDFLPEVFAPFRQAESSLTRKHRGLGIGLAVVRHLVELHAGSVSARSPGPGRGASFTVKLPRTETLPRPEQASDPRDQAAPGVLGAGAPPPSSTGSGEASRAAPELPHSLEGLKLLLVDDEADTLLVLAQLFEHCGAQVLTALSAEEALSLLIQRRPDILIADIAMPEEDGYSLMRKIRSLGPDRGGSVLALALTARAREEDREEALRAGFHRYMAKPVEPADLIAAIRELIRENRRV